MTSFERYIEEIEKKVVDVNNFFNSNEDLLNKVRRSAVIYSSELSKQNKEMTSLTTEAQKIYTYLMDCFYYNCLVNKFRLFKESMPEREKRFSNVLDSQKHSDDYYVPSIEEIKYIYLAFNWSQVPEIEGIKASNLDSYDPILQVMVKEFGLPIVESKKEVEFVSTLLKDLILKYQIQNLSEKDTYQMLEYLKNMIKIELETISMEKETIRKKYSNTPISYESDLVYQDLIDSWKYAEKIKGELSSLKTPDEIKQYIISTFISNAELKEREVEIYSSKRYLEENSLTEKTDELIEMFEETQSIEEERARIADISEKSSDVQQLFEMSSFKEILKKEEETRIELKRAQEQLERLGKSFLNNLYLTVEQISLPTNIKKNNNATFLKTQEILATKISEDKENFWTVKEQVNIIKENLFKTIRDQLIVINVVYPIYEIVRANEKGINTDEDVIGFFVNQIVTNSNFSIKSYIERISKKIEREGMERIEIHEEHVIEKSSEIFPEETPQIKDDEFITRLASKLETVKNSIENSQNPNTLPNEELEVLLKYAQDLKEIREWYSQEELEDKITENYYSIKKI